MTGRTPLGRQQRGETRRLSFLASPAIRRVEAFLPAAPQSCYCGDVSCVTPSYTWQDSWPFEETLQRIKECVYFPDGLSYFPWSRML